MLELDIKELPPRILYIGNANSNPGVYYLQGLIDAGYRVYHVGVNSKSGFELSNIPERPYNIVTEVGPAQVNIREFSLKSLLDIVGHEWDAIVHVQNWLYFTDYELSPIPYYFYCTEVAYPRIPRCAWYVLSATHTIKKQNKRNSNWIRSYLYHPHSIPIIRGKQIKYPKLKRTILGSFAGELYSLPLYKTRREIVKNVEKLDGFETHYLGPKLSRDGERKPESGKGKLKAIPYSNLLLKSKSILNVPSVGGANFRDLEGPALGAMLVTIETPDLLLMGFEDGVNCRTYKTSEEAMKIIESEYDVEIAKKGWELIHFGRDWWQHNNFDVAKIFRYKGYQEFEDPSQNYMNFKLLGELKFNHVLEALLLEGIINSYDHINDSLKIIPKTAIMIEPILKRLGLVEWHTDGHLIFHRLKELATYMYRNNGIKIPDHLLGIIEKIKEKKKLSGIGLYVPQNEN